MNLLCKVLIWCFLVCLLATRAQAQDPEPFRGIFCTSQEAMERVVTLGKEHGGAQQGIIAVNLETPNSCFYGTIVGVRQKIVGTVTDPDTGFLLDITTWKILKVVLIADFENGRMIPVGLELVDEIIRYTLEGSKQTPV